MSDQQSSAWPIICGVLAVVTVGSLAVVTLLLLRLRDQVIAENWKERWHEDTTALAREIKFMSQKVADESYARVKAENQVAALKAQIEDLSHQLIKARHKVASPPSP